MKRYLYRTYLCLYFLCQHLFIGVYDMKFCDIKLAYDLAKICTED